MSIYEEAVPCLRHRSFLPIFVVPRIDTAGEWWYYSNWEVSETELRETSTKGIGNHDT